MTAADNLSLPQFSSLERKVLTQRSVWDEPANAHHVAALVERHTTKAPTLHRGVAGMDATGLKEGASMSIPHPASFSTDPDTAADFALGDNSHDHRTVFHVSGAAGVPVHHVSNIPHEQEWLARGEFTVARVVHAPEDDVNHHVWLRPS